MRPVNVCLIALSALGLVSGCSSTPPNKTGSHRLASILVENHTQQQIEDSVIRVFEGHAFRLTKHNEENIIFEKPGSFMDALAYGDWYGGGVWDRVAVYITERAPGQTLVDCDAAMVQEPDDPFFQTSRPVFKGRRGRYQELLDEVNKDLLTEPTGTGTAPGK